MKPFYKTMLVLMVAGAAGCGKQGASSAEAGDSHVQDLLKVFQGILFF